MTVSQKIIVCPYCGETQSAGDRCRSCRGLFEALSLQATQNDMGPWFIYEPARPFRPGCSYETVAKMIERGQITRYTVVRGPTTRQFWTIARHVAGVAHLLGYCHACDAEVAADAHGCHSCGVPFGAYLDRNHLGLDDVRPLPGEAPDDGAFPGADPAASPGAHSTAPRTISSFASDAELVSTMSRPSGPPPSVASPTAEPARDPSDADQHGSVLDNPLVRAQQRRLARQQRTIRFLTGLVIAVALGGALVAVIGASMNRGPARDRDDAAVTEAEAPASNRGTSPAEESNAVPTRPALDSGATDALPATPDLVDPIIEPVIEPDGSTPAPLDPR